MEYYWWFIAAFILIILEILTPGFFFLWFGIGALVAGGLDLLGVSGILAQSIVFVVVSTVLVALSRTIFKNLFIKNSPGIELKTNIDALIGMQGIVTSTIDNDLSEGRALIQGQDWSARSASGNRIENHSRIKVIGFRGAKAIVEEI